MNKTHDRISIVVDSVFVLYTPLLYLQKALQTSNKLPGAIGNQPHRPLNSRWRIRKILILDDHFVCHKASFYDPCPQSCRKVGEACPPTGPADNSRMGGLDSKVS